MNGIGVGLSNKNTPYSNFHGAHMRPTWVLSAQGGPHVGPMNLVIKDYMSNKWPAGKYMTHEFHCELTMVSQLIT